MKEKTQKKGNLFEEEKGLSGDNMGKTKAEYNFEKNTKELMDQLEKYQQKREIEMKKLDSEVKAVNRVLDSQRNQLQNDINNL